MWAAVSCSCTGCTVLCQTAVSRIVHFPRRRLLGFAKAKILRRDAPSRLPARNGERQRCLRTELTPVFRFPSYALLMRSTKGIFVRIFVWMAPR
jgi:hypothetical protein